MGLQDKLRQIDGVDEVLLDEPMSGHCSFHTGGPADYFVRAKSVEGLAAALAILQEEKVPVFLLGRGTNILVSDKGYRGAVVTMVAGGASSKIADSSFTEVRVEGNHVIAGAGASLYQVAVAARDHGLTGVEFAAGIPGSVGGAIMMNAGAYGGEMSQVVESVSILRPDGTLCTKSGEEMDFGYRHSILKDEPGIVTETTLFLPNETSKEEITATMDELAKKRIEKQPLEYASAGSTFKRPQGTFAGKVIMDAGLRGFAVGDACVSEKHCGFVVNKKAATSEDILKVITEVERRVKEDSGISLEREVILLGDF